MSKFNPERAIFLNDKTLIQMARKLFRVDFKMRKNGDKKQTKDLFFKSVYKLYPELKEKHHVYLTADHATHSWINFQIRYKDYKEMENVK